jgi:hypothetical protein
MLGLHIHTEFHFDQILRVEAEKPWELRPDPPVPRDML